MGRQRGEVATVDGQCDAGHVAGLLRREPDDRVGDLLRLGDPAERVRGHQPLVQGGVLDHHVRDQRCVDQAWADSVDPDAAIGVVQGGALGQADLGVLGGHVARVTEDTGEARPRGDVHD